MLFDVYLERRETERSRACEPLERLSLCASWMIQNKTRARFSVSYLDRSVLPSGFDGSDNGRVSEDEDDDNDNHQ